MAARDTANALRTFVEASRGVAAHLPDLDSKLHLLECVRGVVQNSGVLLQESEIALNDPNNPEIRQKLAKVCCIINKLFKKNADQILLYVLIWSISVASMLLTLVSLMFIQKPKR